MHLRTPSSLAIWVALFLSLSGLHCGGGGGSSGEEDTATGEEGSQQQDSAEDGEEGEEGDSGTTDQSGSESTGEGEATTPTESEGESNALPPADATSLSSLAVDSSKIAISVPVDGNTTLTGSSASFVVLDDSTANCSAIALSAATSSGGNTQVTLSADCSFSLSVPAIAGDTLTLSISDSSGSRSYTSVTIPSETSITLEDALLEIHTGDFLSGLTANTAYKLCVADGKQSACIDPAAEGSRCMDATSNANGYIYAFVTAGKTYQAVSVSGDGAITCQGKYISTDAEIESNKTAFSSSRSEAETSNSASSEPAKPQEFNLVTSDGDGTSEGDYLITIRFELSASEDNTKELAAVCSWDVAFGMWFDLYFETDEYMDVPDSMYTSILKEPINATPIYDPPLMWAVYNEKLASSCNTSPTAEVCDITDENYNQTDRTFDVYAKSERILYGDAEKNTWAVFNSYVFKLAYVGANPLLIEGTFSCGQPVPYYSGSTSDSCSEGGSWAELLLELQSDNSYYWYDSAQEQANNNTTMRCTSEECPEIYYEFMAPIKKSGIVGDTQVIYEVRDGMLNTYKHWEIVWAYITSDPSTVPE